MNASDALSQQNPYSLLHNEVIFIPLLDRVTERNRVSHYDLVNGTVLDSVEGRLVEQTMSAESIDLVRTMLFQLVSSSAQGASSVHQVVKYDDILAFNVTDEIHSGYLLCFSPLLHNHG